MYLANAGAIIFREAVLDLVNGWGDFGELLAVCFFCLGAHAGNGHNLSILDDALLELAEQDPKAWIVSVGGDSGMPLARGFDVMLTCGIVGRPEAVLKARHVVCG